MKLSDLNPDDVEVVEQAPAQAPAKLKLSDLDPAEVQSVDAATEVAQPEAETISKAESLARGGVQSATLGFADELEGGVRAAADTLLGPSELKNLLDTYAKYRDKSRQEYQAAQQANPGTTLIGNILGGVATAPLGLGAAKAITGASKLGLGALSALGATEGAVAGLGTSDADLTKGEVLEAAKDASLGATIGGAAPSVISGIGGLLSKPVQMLKGSRFGQDLIKSTQLGKKGVSISGIKAGQDAERGIINSAQEITDNLTRAKEEAGQIIGEAQEKALNTGKEVNVQGLLDDARQQIEDLALTDENKKKLILELEKRLLGETPAPIKISEKIERRILPGEDATQPAPVVTKSVKGEGIDNGANSVDDIELPEGPQRTVTGLKERSTLDPEGVRKVTSTTDSVLTPERQIIDSLSVADARRLQNNLKAIVDGGADPATKRVATDMAKKLRERFGEVLDQPSREQMGEGNAQWGATESIFDKLGTPETQSALGGIKPATDKTIGYVQNLTRELDPKVRAEEGLIEPLLNKALGSESAEPIMNRAKEASDYFRLVKGDSKQIQSINPQTSLLGSAVQLSNKAANAAGLATRSVKEAVKAGQQAIYDASPEMIQQLASKLASTGRANGARFSQILQSTVGKDKIGRNATLFMLMQDPDFKKEVYGDPEEETKE